MRRRPARRGRSRGLRTACCTDPGACSRTRCAPRTAAGCTGSKASCRSARDRRWGCSCVVLRRSVLGPAAAGDVGGVFADVVDEAVLESLVGGEPSVAVTVGVDLLDRLAGLGGGDLRETVL